jgi:hypothetical protein
MSTYVSEEHIASIFRVELCFPPAFKLVSCSAYTSTLKMEAICSSETLVNIYWTTRRYIPEDYTLQSGNLLLKEFKRNVRMNKGENRM